MSAPPTVLTGDDRWQMHWIYWPTLLGSALLAAFVPWYLGELEIDLRPTLQILLTGGVLAVLFLQWRSSMPRWLATIAPFVASIMLLDGVWLTLGTFDASSFLLLLVLPVFSAALVSRGWLVYSIAGLAICLTGVSAFFANPMFRWYVEQLQVYPDAWRQSAATLSDAVRIGAVDSGHEHMVVLAGYSIAIVAVASLGSVTARALSRMERRLELATRSREETEALTAMLMDGGEGLELIVAGSSGRIVSSGSSCDRLITMEPDNSRSLFEILEPQYPEKLQQLIESESGGEVAAMACRPDDVQRFFDFAAEPLTLEGERVVRLRLRETASADLAVNALEELTLGLVILSADWRVLFVNEPFRAVFPSAAVGSSAGGALSGFGDLPAGWWEIVPRRRAAVRFSDDDREYRLELARTDGSDRHSLTVICLASGGQS